MAGAAFKMNLKPFMGTVKKAARRVADRQTMAEEIGEMLVSSVLTRFQKGVGPDGEAWEPLKKREGQPLVDKGRLRSSVGYEATATAVAVGTNLVYGAIHQFGGQAGRNRAVTIPERPYLGFSEEDTTEAREIIQDHIARSFGK